MKKSGTCSRKKTHFESSWRCRWKGVVTRKLHLNRIWLKYNFSLHAGLYCWPEISNQVLYQACSSYAPWHWYWGSESCARHTASLHLINILQLTKLIFPNSFNACQSSWFSGSERGCTDGTTKILTNGRTNKYMVFFRAINGW